MPGTRLVWLRLDLFAVAVLIGGPAVAQDLSPIDTFFATFGAALTGTTGRAIGLVALAMMTMGGFIATLSFVRFAGSAIIGYAALRALAAWDPQVHEHGAASRGRNRSLRSRHRVSESAKE